MMRKLIKIKPNDTIFFRDGKPFTQGESKWHSSMLMPNPSVLYGTIFSEILRQTPKLAKNKKFHTELADNLKIKAIYLYNDKEDEIYLPAPLDLFENEKGDIRYGKFIKENDENNLLMFSPYSDDYKYERVDGKFINLSNIKNGYFQRQNNFSVYAIDKFINSTYKIGIALDNKSRTAKDEHLYRLDMVEFNSKDWGYLLEIEIKENINKKGTVKIGGEGKTGTYEFLDKKPFKLRKYEEILECINKSNRIKLVFTTPTILEDGCKLRFKNNAEIEILGSAIGKPSFVGGFDVKAGKEKTMKKAIPPGSIFILESDKFKSQTFKKIKEYLNGDNKNNECLNNKIISFSEEELIRGYDSFIVVPFEEGLR